VNLEDLLAELRVRLDDEAQPYLWSDETLVAYLNEAEREACVRARLIYDDTTPEFTVLAVTAGNPIVALDTRVLAVDRAILDGRELDRTNVLEMDRRHHGWNWRERTGRPFEFIEEQTSLRLAPVPQENGVLRLSLWRLPTRDMVALTDEPEIAQRFHLQMIEWAIHLAFKRRDADAEDAQRAALAAATFTAAFGERPSADVQRKQKIKRVPVVRPQW